MTVPRWSVMVTMVLLKVAVHVGDARVDVLGALGLDDLDFFFTAADFGEDVALLVLLGTIGRCFRGGGSGHRSGRSWSSGGSLGGRSGVLRDFFVSHIKKVLRVTS